MLSPGAGRPLFDCRKTASVRGFLPLFVLTVTGNERLEQIQSLTDSVAALGIRPVPRIVSSSIRIISVFLRLISARMGPILTGIGPIGATRRPNVGTGAAIRVTSADIGHVAPDIRVLNLGCDAVTRCQRQRLRQWCSRKRCCREDAGSRTYVQK